MFPHFHHRISNSILSMLCAQLYVTTPLVNLVLEKTEIARHRRCKREPPYRQRPSQLFAFSSFFPSLFLSSFSLFRTFIFIYFKLPAIVEPFSKYINPTLARRRLGLSHSRAPPRLGWPTVNHNLS